MSQPTKITLLTAEEYLDSESNSPFRREYVHGQIFAMSGASEAHNKICGNLHAKLHSHMRGSNCHLFMDQMKLRIDAANAFYYPDIMVTCEPYQSESVFKERPILLIEVLSPSTASIDRREKLIAYQQIDTLVTYLMVHQKRRWIEVLNRSIDTSWEKFNLSATDTLQLTCLPNGLLTVELSEIYDGTGLPFRVEEEVELYEFN